MDFTLMVMDPSLTNKIQQYGHNGNSNNVAIENTSNAVEMMTV
jgi:hypothetical protein